MNPLHSADLLGGEKQERREEKEERRQLCFSY
jgi:hypothetical protein